MAPLPPRISSLSLRASERRGKGFSPTACRTFMDTTDDGPIGERRRHREAHPPNTEWYGLVEGRRRRRPVLRYQPDAEQELHAPPAFRPAAPAAAAPAATGDGRCDNVSVFEEYSDLFYISRRLQTGPARELKQVTASPRPPQLHLIPLPYRTSASCFSSSAYNLVSIQHNVVVVSRCAPVLWGCARANPLPPMADSSE